MTLNRILILFFGLELWTATASAWSCHSDFEDVASRAVLSAVVFEGRARRRLTPAASASNNASEHRSTRIVFRVLRVLKGTLDNGTSVVAVGRFRDAADDPAKCVASTASVAIGASYVVFVGNGTFPSSAKGQTTSGKKSSEGGRRRRKDSGIPVFTISGRPETSRPEVIETVGRYSCSNCREYQQISRRQACFGWRLFSDLWQFVLVLVSRIQGCIKRT